MPTTKLKVEYQRINKLIPYAMNSRTHSEGQVEKIAASIKEFGFISPVIVDGDGGIVAGHGRVLAAKRLEMKTVPTIAVGYLTDAQKRAFIIADNRLALDAGWDDEILIAELERLAEDEVDLELTGFSTEELNALLDLGDDAGGDGGEGGDGEGAGKSPRTAQITYTIAFDDAEQQAYFYDFLKRLRQKDPDTESTIAGRLISFLEAHRESY